MYPPPLEFSNSEEFGANGVNVYLEWQEDSGVTYTVYTMVLRHKAIISSGRESIQLMLSYNAIYSVNITSTLCGQNSLTTTINFNYGEFI